MFLNYNNFSEKCTVSDLSVLSCGFQNCSPLHSFGPAIRDYYLLHFVKKGTGVFTTSQGRFPIHEGGMFLIYPSEVTFYCADQEDPWDYFWVGFVGIKARQLLARIGFSESHPVLNTLSVSEVGLLFSQMNQLVSTSNMPDLGCLGILYQIFQYFIEEDPHEKLASQNNTRLYIEKSIHYFEENYPYAISIQNLAAHLGLDRTTLFRNFIRECGFAPQEYLIRFRMKKACELLRKTTLSIAEISSSVGMDNSAHFATIFKNRLGISPREYRKNPCEIIIMPE